MDEPRDIVLNIDTWQIQQIVDSLSNAISAEKSSRINVDYIPPIQVNLSGGTFNSETKEEKIIDERSGVERARLAIDTLLSAVDDKNAKNALEGNYDALNNTLERAYILLKTEIDIEIEKKKKELKDLQYSE